MRDHTELSVIHLHRLCNHIKAAILVLPGPRLPRRLLLPSPLPLTDCVDNNVAELVSLRARPHRQQEKLYSPAWHPYIRQGHFIGYADAPLPWSPITHFPPPTKGGLQGGPIRSVASGFAGPNKVNSRQPKAIQGRPRQPEAIQAKPRQPRATQGPGPPAFQKENWVGAALSAKGPSLKK